MSTLAPELRNDHLTNVFYEQARLQYSVMIAEQVRCLNSLVPTLQRQAIGGLCQSDEPGKLTDEVLAALAVHQQMEQKLREDGLLPWDYFSE